MTEVRYIEFQIKRHVEEGQEYFLVTSIDIPGLLAQGDTVQEAMDIAKDLLPHFQEDETTKTNWRSLETEISYPVFV